MVINVLETLSNACVLFTIGVFSAGIPQCWEMIKQKNTENVPFLPYIMTFVNNAVWIAYSVLIDNWTVYIVNVIGVVLQIIYISIYLFYTGFLVKETKMIAVGAGFTSLVVMYTYLAGGSSFSMNLRTAIQEKSTKSISFPLTVATFFCTLSWTVYGLLIKDIYLVIPNSLGLLTSLPRFYVFGRFRGSNYEHVHTTI